jgi:hydroxymethylpyrimidine/phosphomethylpyrimidine kinase
MYNSEKTLPVIMSFSAHDPTGGSGIQADIETIGALGGHCAPIITCITARDTADLYQFSPCSARLVQAQAKAVLEDIPIAAFKIGLLGSIENVAIVHQILNDYPNIPVVLDPTMQIGSKRKSLDLNLLQAITTWLLPKVKVCTPNASEAQQMAPEADILDACAQEIMADGAEYVLITGNFQTPNKNTNTLYSNYRRLDAYQWDRLPLDYQGSGCTLSAAIAAYLAHSLPVTSAIFEAQQYTYECLKKAYRMGMGQHLPNRFYWSREAQ